MQPASKPLGANVKLGGKICIANVYDISHIMSTLEKLRVWGEVCESCHEAVDHIFIIVMLIFGDNFERQFVCCRRERLSVNGQVYQWPHKKGLQ